MDTTIHYTNPGCSPTSAGSGAATTLSRSSTGSEDDRTASVDHVCWPTWPSNSSSGSRPSRPTSTFTKSISTTLYSWIRSWTTITTRESCASRSWWPSSISTTVVTTIPASAVNDQRNQYTTTSCYTSRCATITTDTDAAARTIISLHLLPPLGSSIVFFTRKEFEREPASYAFR
jgi:hypothetical protein